MFSLNVHGLGKPKNPRPEVRRKSALEVKPEASDSKCQRAFRWYLRALAFRFVPIEPVCLAMLISFWWRLRSQAFRFVAQEPFIQFVLCCVDMIVQHDCPVEPDQP